MLLSTEDEAVDEHGDPQARGLVAELFRAVNERITELGRGYSLPELNLVCECGDETCTRLLVMTPQEYTELRRHPGRFAVLPGHQQLDDELIERRTGFLVVACRTDTPAALTEPGQVVRG